MLPVCVCGCVFVSVMVFVSVVVVEKVNQYTASVMFFCFVR